MASVKPKQAKAKKAVKAKPKAKAAAKAKPKAKFKFKSKSKSKSKPKPKAKAKPAAKAKAKPAAKATAAPVGRFIWHDMMSTDAAASCAFYTSLFGWQLDEVNMGSFKLHIINVAGARVGSIMQEPGIPQSHWIPYIAVDDVDGTCARVAKLGGDVCVGAGDVPKLGRFAVVNDPQGALFSPLKRPPGTPTDAPRMGQGAFCWDELHTSDPEAAANFYVGLLGWQVRRVPSPEQQYWLANNGQADVAGLTNLPDAPRGPFWLPYVAVEDVDASARKVRELGGRVFVEPENIPGIGRFSVIADTTGATIAMMRGIPQAQT